MTNLVALSLITIMLFVMLLNQQKIENKKIIFSLAFASWLAASGLIFIQETVHQQVIDSSKISNFPSQEIKLDDQKKRR